MGEPESFSSLMAMVENHLSKTSLSTSSKGEGQAGPSFSLPNICSVRNSNSETLLPPPATVMQLPRFEVKNSEITEILAHQVKNMLIARENALNEEKENQRLAMDLKKMKLNENNTDEYLIDLSSSIIRPGQSHQIKQEVKSTVTNNSSVESLSSNTDHKKITKKPQKIKEETLPICQDMSFILFQRVRKAKCSSFGKVLTAKLRPVAAPYFQSKITNPNVIPFDFATPSPCDINKERMLLPPVDPYAHMTLMERIMATIKDETL